MLVYLNPDIDLVAVCSVSCNQSIENTTENALRIKELLNASFPERTSHSLLNIGTFAIIKL